MTQVFGNSGVQYAPGVVLCNKLFVVNVNLGLSVGPNHSYCCIQSQSILCRCGRAPLRCASDLPLAST